jgi:hypothetical protein
MPPIIQLDFLKAAMVALESAEAEARAIELGEWFPCEHFKRHLEIFGASAPVRRTGLTLPL